jgi:hypothetical protein
MALKMTTPENTKKMTPESTKIDFELVGDKQVVQILILKGNSAEGLNLCRMIPRPEMLENRRDDKAKMLQVPGKLLSITFPRSAERASFVKSLKVGRNRRAEIEARFNQFRRGRFPPIGEDMARTHAPRLPEIGSFASLEIDTAVEIGDSQPIRQGMRG